MAQVMSYGASDFFGLGLGHNHSQRFEPSDRFRAGGLPPRGYYYPQQSYDRQAGYRHGGGVNKKRSKRDRQQQNGAPGHVNRTRRDNARAARQYSIQGRWGRDARSGQRWAKPHCGPVFRGNTLQEPGLYPFAPCFFSQGTVPDISQELALSLPRAPPHNALETFQGT